MNTDIKRFLQFCGQPEKWKKRGSIVKRHRSCKDWSNKILRAPTSLKYKQTTEKPFEITKPTDYV